MFVEDTEPERIHDDTLVDRIKWTTLARVVLLTAVLVFAVTLDVGVGLRPATPMLDAALYRLTTGFFLLSFLTLLATQILQRGPHLRFLAYGSVAIDVAMAMMLVAATDGLQSVFLFAFPLAVLNAALLLRRPGAMTAATLATAALSVMTTAHIGWLTLPLLPLRVVVQPGGPVPLDLAVQLAVQVAAVYATSFLSTYLVRELDQSRQKALQQRVELARLRLRYADVVSSLPDGLLTVGVGGVVTGVNPAGAQILGQDASRVLGQPLSVVLPELAALHQTTREVWGEMEIAREDLRRTRELHRDQPGGAQQILACRIAGLHESVDSAQPVGRLVVFRDVTQTRRQEEQHRDRERLATVGTMAMAVAHEIRNPLASISGAVQMLESSPDLAATDKALMAIVERETRHLSEWIGEFLDFAKPRALQVAPVDLRNLVAETLDAIDHDSRVLAGGIELQRGPSLQSRNTHGGSEFLIIGDAALLRQMVWNLVINAAQAVMATDERTVRVTLEELGTRLKLVVDDSGPGLGVDEMAHIFEPFYTTKGEGTGLGLATVKRHVTAHRGEIDAGDSPLGGARFTVLLPRRSSGDTVMSWTRQVPAVPATDKPAETPQKAEV